MTDTNMTMRNDIYPSRVSDEPRVLPRQDGSASNITPFPRSNAFIVFNALSNKLEAPFGPATPRPDFIAARGRMAPVAPVSAPLLSSAA